MKSLFAFLLVGVSVALAVEGPNAAPEPTQTTDVNPGPQYCCFQYVKQPVPLSLLKSFEYTNGKCSLPAVIFLTKRGREICANPAERWVQDRIRELSPP